MGGFAHLKIVISPIEIKRNITSVLKKREKAFLERFKINFFKDYTWRSDRFNRIDKEKRSHYQKSYDERLYLVSSKEML